MEDNVILKCPKVHELKSAKAALLWLFYLSWSIQYSTYAFVIFSYILYIHIIHSLLRSRNHLDSRWNINLHRNLEHAQLFFNRFNVFFWKFEAIQNVVWCGIMKYFLLIVVWVVNGLLKFFFQPVTTFTIKRKINIYIFWVNYKKKTKSK